MCATCARMQIMSDALTLLSVMDSAASINEEVVTFPGAIRGRSARKTLEDADPPRSHRIDAPRCAPRAALLARSSIQNA